MPHGIDGVKVREQVSTKCLSSGVPEIFYRCRIFGAGAGFRYQPVMAEARGVVASWGALGPQEACPIFRAVENM